MTIIYWTASWIAGIWLASNLQMPWSFWIILCLLGTLCAIMLRGKPLSRMIAICFAILCLGALRYSHAVLPPPDNHVSKYNGAGELAVTGIVVEEPDIRDFSTDLLLEADSLSTVNGEAVSVIGQVLIRVPRYPLISYGSRLRTSGKLNSPANLSNFDYEQYLARRGIFSEMNKPSVIVLETGLGNPLTRALLAIKSQAKETIDRLFPEPHAALLSGILLGNDRGLPRDLKEDFQATGTTHIIAISGFNIAIIAGILLRGSRFFVANRLAAIITLLGISLYAILVGAEASVVRAAIMGGLFIVALQFLGRESFLPATLCAAALFMSLANPFALWDAGFQLSFMAVLGLVLYVGPWSRWIGEKLEPRLGLDQGRRATRMIADIFLATIAATIMTLPIILIHFDTFSLVSPLANFMIMPAQPGVMIIGGLATILGMISPLLGQIPAWVAWLFLTYTINLVRFFAGLPLSSVDVTIGLTFLIAFYGFVVAVTWFTGQEKETKLTLLGRSPQSRIIRGVIGVGLIIALLTGIWAWSQPDGKLHVTFFDVGQGDAIFIETPNGRQIVVDGGRIPSVFLDQLGSEMSFWDKDIDIVVATHPDEDHILGLVETVDRYQVDLLLVNGEEAGTPAGYEELLAAAKEQQIPIRRALAGEVIELGDGTRLEILYPGPDLETEDRNENSVSVRLVYGDFRLLLTGDAEEKAERMMMESGRPLQSTVFKAGHHGSRSSSSRAFLQAVQPRLITISAGKDNKYEHPHPEMLQRGEDIGAIILRTDELGTIEVISDGHRVWWHQDAN